MRDIGLTVQTFQQCFNWFAVKCLSFLSTKATDPQTASSRSFHMWMNLWRFCQHNISQISSIVTHFSFIVSLAWLDGSDISYSNWVKVPDTEATCGRILRHSGFQWEVVVNCSQELGFICQFGTFLNQSANHINHIGFFSLIDYWFFCSESDRSIACDGQNATLQCGSGQILEIDDSFYGRKTTHYCRSKLPGPPTSVQDECSWIDVTDSVTGISMFYFYPEDREETFSVSCY